MPFMPFDILWIWLRGLFSLALIGLALYLIRDGYERLYVWDTPVLVISGPPQTRETDRAHAAVPPGTYRWVGWRPGLNRQTADLLGGSALLLWSFVGGPFILPLLRRPGADEPKAERTGTVRRIKRPDGTELQVEFYGPDDAQPIVLTHGWGTNSTEWYYAKRQLGDRFRLIVWDLPGLGESKGPDNKDWSLEKMASDLDAVVDLAGGRPVILLGHSIGGMIMLTFCRLFHESLGRRVRGLIFVHTSYTNPVKTTEGAPVYTAIQKPLIEPLLHLTIGLSPLVWLMNWLSYLNGSSHQSTERSGFSGGETRGQLDFAARFLAIASPAVLARGMFGMLRYDATATLATIDVPALVVVGDLDPMTKPEAGQRIHQGIAGSRLVTLAPAKHMGLIEYHDRFAEAVVEFIGSCEAARPGIR